VDGVRLAPLPVQQPRVPVWIGGDSRAALRRAARWDGWIIGVDDQQGDLVVTPEQLATSIATIHAQRTAPGPYDVAITATSRGPEDRVFAGYADAGVTWWLEHLHGYRGPYERLLARVTAGPPT
jgi:alkanesulfonate monooxygenase SsuD/methylene tetrahydromethanopterin reductase-like flavin-dependent oxidoreductase (luciferase family)